ncbi:hypothetical protein KQI65_06060 [bacterium]|nr:hypothetical protein [bacterium]
MQRFFKSTMYVFTLLFIAASIAATGCSDDDGPVDPGTNDTGSTSNMDEKVRPVVFVHGQFEAGDLYTQMAQLFARNGYTDAQLDAIDLVSYINGSDPDVAEMATQISAAVDALISSSGESRVDIVAHGIGVNAVMHYIANMQGTDKLAHVVYTGGLYDLSLAVNGDVTPGPCDYMTVRSDGSDELQGGNSTYGELNGASNEQMAGLDNVELATDPAVFAKVYKFFTGENPGQTSLHAPRPGETYTVSGKVIEFIDNRPVQGVYVTAIPIRTLSNGEIQRQIGGSPVETDAGGNFSFDITLSPETHYEFRIQNLNSSYYDMHVYVQAFRENVNTLRFRMIPRSPSGSQPLTTLSTAMRTGDHANFFVHTLNEAMQSAEDNLTLTRFNPAFEPIGEVSVLTPGNAPAAGVSAMAGNTTVLAILDYDMNQSDGTGPISASGINMFGINSFDAYLIGQPSNHQTQVKFNNSTLGVQNFASKGGVGASNGGFTLVQFEY